MWRAAAAAALVGSLGSQRPPGGAPEPDPHAGAQPKADAEAGGAQPTDAQTSNPVRSRSKQLIPGLLFPSTSPDQTPDVFFLRVRLEETGEMFQVNNCRINMTVRELKEELDLMVGVPFNLQRLHYLDQGVLMDNVTLKFYDVVPGGIISLCIWHYDGWTQLVLAAVEGDPSKLSGLGISEDSFFRTANSKLLKGEQWKQWTSQRAFVALYISAHRGHAEAVKYLLELGANCFGKTPLGRTPLHVVAAMGRLDCIAPLVDRGVSIHDRDLKGETPITIARRLKRRHSERWMFLLYWMAKSGTKDPTEAMVTEVVQKASTRFART